VEAQRIYEREAPEIVGPEDYKGPPLPDEVPSRTPEIEGSGLFEVSTTRRCRWDETYDAAGYLRVLDTYLATGTSETTHVSTSSEASPIS
jgi:hypothetical protein